jgi:hypothetical protein
VKVRCNDAAANAGFRRNVDRDWANAFLGFFWPRLVRALPKVVLLALAVNGFWHLRKDARDWAARHWMPAGGFVSSSLSLLSHSLGLPAPQIALAGYAPGHKFYLVWKSVANGMSYQILSSCGYTGPQNTEFTNLDKPVSTPGAMVDLDHNLCHNPVALEVRSVAPNGDESERSDPIVVTLTEDNVGFTADPLEPAEAAVLSATATPTTSKPAVGQQASQTQQQIRKTVDSHTSDSQKSGNPPHANPPSANPSPVTANDVTQAIQAGIPQTGSLGSRLATAAAVLAGKTLMPGAPHKTACAARNIRFHKEPSPGHPRSILLEWDDSNPRDQANLFAARFSQSQTFDRDVTLIKGHAVYWWPPDDGEQVFLLYLTTVDSHGEESAPSERLMVDLR